MPWNGAERGMLIFAHQLALVPSGVEALSFPWETGKHICSFPCAEITYIPPKAFLKIPLSEITFHHALEFQMEKERRPESEGKGTRRRQCVQLGLNLI